MHDGPTIGPFQSGRVHHGDCMDLIPRLPDESVDVVVTSPPYWGLRCGASADALGAEEDPRSYLRNLQKALTALLPKLKPEGIAWLNIADVYNTPVNWTRESSFTHSTLGPRRDGLTAGNAAHAKPRAGRKAFIDDRVPWLTYGNLLGLPGRLIAGLCDQGWLLRGEVIWVKPNPMPEGQCRRPHRTHEPIYLLAKSEQHRFRVTPPVRSVWEVGGSGDSSGRWHHSRFPEAIPANCINAYGAKGWNVIVCDPFAGSGTTGVAAAKSECSFIGFEIDETFASAANARLQEETRPPPCSQDPLTGFG